MSVLRRKDGQVDLSGGKIHVVSGTYEAKRRNEMYLNLHHGEIEEHPERGVNWFDFVFSKKTTQEQAEAYLKSKILQIPGNKELTGFEMKTDKSRNMVVRYRVKSDLNDEFEVKIPPGESYD